MLKVQKIPCFFPKKQENLNDPFKNSVNGTKGAVLFSQERGALNNGDKYSANGTKGTVLFS